MSTLSNIKLQYEHTHFIPEGNPAPPRPRKPEALISEMICGVRQQLPFRLSATISNIPNHDPSAGFPSSYASRHTSWHSPDPLRDVRRGSGKYDPDPSIHQIVSASVEEGHLQLWQVHGSAVLEKRRKGIGRWRTLLKEGHVLKWRQQPWVKARVAKALRYVVVLD